MIVEPYSMGSTIQTGDILLVMNTFLYFRFAFSLKLESILIKAEKSKSMHKYMYLTYFYETHLLNRQGTK